MKNYVRCIVNGLMKKILRLTLCFLTLLWRAMLLWLPEEKPQLVLCFTIYRKVVSVNRRRLNDDTLYQKLLIMVYIS